MPSLSRERVDNGVVFGFIVGVIFPGVLICRISCKVSAPNCSTNKPTVAWKLQEKWNQLFKFRFLMEMHVGFCWEVVPDMDWRSFMIVVFWKSRESQRGFKVFGTIWLCEFYFSNQDFIDFDDIALELFITCSNWYLKICSFFFVREKFVSHADLIVSFSTPVFLYFFGVSLTLVDNFSY